MPAYEDKRDGRWRYRKRVDLPDGRRIRITGTPATDTKKAAEAAERAHIDRVLHPERARAQAAAVPERKEKTTFREFAKRFMAGYLPGQKPSERKAKNQILNTHLIPFFGLMGLDEIRVSRMRPASQSVTKRRATATASQRRTPSLWRWRPCLTCAGLGAMHGSSGARCAESRSCSTSKPREHPQAAPP